MLSALPFFTGSMPAYLLGSTDRLDIDGVATTVTRIDEDPLLGEGWSHYGGDAGGHRYSRAAHITPGNVSRLSIAWQYRTGHLTAHADAMQRATAEGTPILVDDSLIFCTPFNEVIALDPANGHERWRFEPEIDLQQRPANQFVCRGVAHWRGEAGGGHCASRIFVATNDARLLAIDARDGKPCFGFGPDGEVVIDPGMDLLWPGEMQITSAPAVIGDTVVTGSAISDNERAAAPAGSVRAFDASTGEPLWTFDPIPRERSDPAMASWPNQTTPSAGHANVWSSMSVDVERGLVFLPTSSPSPDFYGGLRPGDNRHANSVVALDAGSGAPVWAFQTAHHDLWDYDVPAQPGLYTVQRNGELHDVVAQVTKTGFVFVLERESGEPFLPIEERAVAGAGADGEAVSATQPFPVLTAPLVPSTLSPNDAFGVTWFDRKVCRGRIAALRTEGLFTPPSEQGSIVYPFTGGGQLGERRVRSRAQPVGRQHEQSRAQRQTDTRGTRRAGAPGVSRAGDRATVGRALRRGA